MHKLSFLLVLVNDLNVWFGLNNEFSNDSKHVKAPPVDVHGVDTLRLQFSQELDHPELYKGESLRKRKSFNKCWGVGRRFRLVFRPRAVARGRQRFRVGVEKNM